MLQILQLSWLLSIFLGIAICAPVVEVEPEALTRKLPNNDEWYRPEKGFDKHPPGTILKYRPVPKGISINNVDAIKTKSAWQILYRTTNSVGEPEATVVTLVSPSNGNPKALFVYHWFADSAFRECIPSIAMQPGTREDNTFTQIQTAMILVGLSQGWQVAVADDGGPDGVFGSGRRAGYATLDAIRAIKSSGNFTGINPDPVTTTYGYSGGSWAGVWASGMQPKYAPDVKIAGTAVGGLIANVTNMIYHWNLPNRTSYAPPVLIGLGKDYANLSTWIDGNLKPELKTDFYKGASQCFDSNWESFSGKRIGDYFKGGIDALYEPVPVSVFRSTAEMERGGRPSNPWYVYQTVGDDASPVGFTDVLLNSHCANGADITFERNPRWLNHSTEMVEGMPGAMRWVADRQAGRPIKPGCHNMTRTDESATSGRQGMLFKGLLDVAAGYFGFPMGPNSFTSFLTKFPERVVF